MTGIAFVCVGNAGRSLMAAAIAEEAVEARGLDVEVVTGGVDPADAVHDEVVAAMTEIGIDVGDRTPRAIQPDDVAACDLVVTMGCDADRFVPPGWAGRTLSWELDHPGGDLESVRGQRDELRERVSALLDEVA